MVAVLSLKLTISTNNKYTANFHTKLGKVSIPLDEYVLLQEKHL